MLTDYLCCAGEKEEYRDILLRRPEKPSNMPVLERIEGTRDGLRIRTYLEELREMGVNL